MKLAACGDVAKTGSRVRRLVADCLWSAPPQERVELGNQKGVNADGHWMERAIRVTQQGSVLLWRHWMDRDKQLGSRQTGLFTLVTSGTGQGYLSCSLNTRMDKLCQVSCKEQSDVITWLLGGSSHWNFKMESYLFWRGGGGVHCNLVTKWSNHKWRTTCMLTNKFKQLHSGNKIHSVHISCDTV